MGGELRHEEFLKGFLTKKIEWESHGSGAIFRPGWTNIFSAFDDALPRREAGAGVRGLKKYPCGTNPMSFFTNRRRFLFADFLL